MNSGVWVIPSANAPVETPVRKAAARVVHEKGPVSGLHPRRFVRPALLALAAVLLVSAIFLPLWGMTLVSVQYPEGLRMVVYPLRMEGELREINMLNMYIGMSQISAAFFVELRMIAGLFAVTAAACVALIMLRRWWATLAPLGLMAGTAVYGLLRMRYRLYQYGHELDPLAPIDIEPFTPPMFGENQIAQFATYAYFSWGTLLPLLAGGLTAVVLWMDLRARRQARAELGGTS
jgi:copper chaperone NosL